MELKQYSMKCDICPRGCEITHDPFSSYCKSRIVDGFENKPYNYGTVFNITLEPLEKKPIFHYGLNLKTLTVGVGSGGCSMGCGYCQNWMVSQQFASNVKKCSPRDIVEIAIDKRVDGICLSYNEPTINIEYLMETSKYARKYGLKFFLKTNGYVSEKYWGDIVYVSDAINIDYKGSPDRYRQVADTNMSRDDYLLLLDNIRYASRNTHTEISVPVYEDYTEVDMKYLLDLPNVPVHLLTLFPAHKYSNRDKTDYNMLKEIKKFVENQFDYVYIQNSFDKNDINTKCIGCKKTIIKRTGLTSKYIGCDCYEYKEGVYNWREWADRKLSS